MISFFGPAGEKDTCGWGYFFGSNDDSSRLFPGYVAFIWRDKHGFNPTFIAAVTQYGERDPHLLPTGIRIWTKTWRLFNRGKING